MVAENNTSVGNRPFMISFLEISVDVVSCLFDYLVLFNEVQ